VTSEFCCSVTKRIAYLRYTAKEVVDILGVFHDALDIDRYV